MNSNIVIVGNGTSILDMEYGNQIDSYSKVVRFNNYGTRGFQKHTGLKTNIWFNVVDFNNKENEWRMNENYEKIYLHSWESNPEKDQLLINFKNFYKHKNNSFLEKIPHNLIKEIVNYSDDPTYTGISTGLIAIWLFLKEYKSVDIIGFDWWNTEKHHYNDNAIRGDLHKPQKEKKIIEKLYSDGRVFMMQKD
jgi:hypothetical protein